MDTRIAFSLTEVPTELGDIALPLLVLTRRWHTYRLILVHDLLVTGWSRDGAVQSALGKNPPRPIFVIDHLAKRSKPRGFDASGTIAKKRAIEGAICRAGSMSASAGTVPALIVPPVEKMA